MHAHTPAALVQHSIWDIGTATAGQGVVSWVIEGLSSLLMPTRRRQQPAALSMPLPAPTPLVPCWLVFAHSCAPCWAHASFIQPLQLLYLFAIPPTPATRNLCHPTLPPHRAACAGGAAAGSGGAAPMVTRLKEDMKVAMKAKDQPRLDAIRMINAAIKQAGLGA